MNIKALARRVVRYFGRPATSVSPQNTYFMAGDGSLWALGGAGTEPRKLNTPTIPVNPVALDRVEEAAQRLYGTEPLKLVTPADWAREDAQRASTAIKPPDEWTWEAWAKEFSSLAIDGWAPCKFAHRAGAESEKAIFVFGIVRGAFGLWRQPFDICANLGAEHEIEFGTPFDTRRDVLTVVTHLRTGIGLGIFATVADAAQACNLAGRVDQWELVDTMTIATIQRTMDAWRDFGIVRSVNAHAHDPNTGHGPFAIMGLSIESASEGKPEKLS